MLRLCSPKGFKWNATFKWTGLLTNHLLSSGLSWDLWRWGGAPTHQLSPFPLLCSLKSQQMVQADSNSPSALGQAASFSVRGSLLHSTSPQMMMMMMKEVFLMLLNVHVRVWSHCMKKNQHPRLFKWLYFQTVHLHSRFPCGEGG